MFSMGLDIILVVVDSVYVQNLWFCFYGYSSIHAPDDGCSGVDRDRG